MTCPFQMVTLQTACVSPIANNCVAAADRPVCKGSNECASGRCTPVTLYQGLTIGVCD